MNKRMIICMVVVIAFAFTGIGSFAMANGINNVIISGSDKAAELSGESLPWYSAHGYPSKDDIAAVGDDERIICPKAENYLNDYRIRFVDAEEENSIYVYRNSAKNSSSPERLDHGAKVAVIAEQGSSSCIIYKTYKNTPRSGWVSTSLLSGKYTGKTVVISKPVNGEKLIGDTQFRYSGEYMIGTECEYMILDEAVSSCTGFTIEYKIRKSNGDCSGGRDIYINNGEGWIWVGNFQYESPKAYHITVHLSQTADVYAIAVPSHSSVSGSFTARQNILDVYSIQ